MLRAAILYTLHFIEINQNQFTDIEIFIHNRMYVFSLVIKHHHNMQQ